MSTNFQNTNIQNQNIYDSDEATPTVSTRLDSQETLLEIKKACAADHIKQAQLFREGIQLRLLYPENLFLKLYCHQEEVEEFLKTLPTPKVYRR